MKLLEWLPMEDRRFLHEGEQLLYSGRASAGHLIVDLARGLVDTLVIWVVVAMAMSLGWWLALSALPPWGAYAVLGLASFLGVSVRRWRLWNHASFRVTTERILIDHHESIFSHPLRTIKWFQYQESFLGRRTILDYLFGVRPICVRYGTPDAQLKVCFPALRYANDLKHYLDKVDGAIRKNDLAGLKPFVAKPRGKRDQESGAQETTA